jgi:hypothetical protein
MANYIKAALIIIRLVIRLLELLHDLGILWRSSRAQLSGLSEIAESCTETRARSAAGF